MAPSGRPGSFHDLFADATGRATVARVGSTSAASSSGAQDRSASITVSTIGELGACRAAIAALLVDCDPDRCFDAEVVVSELVTNALEHGRARTVDVQVRRRGSRLDLVVASAARGAPGSYHPDPDVPDPDDARGRGIVIVRALAESYRVLVHDGTRCDEVVMSLA